jgi:hypothetical protein
MASRQIFTTYFFSFLVFSLMTFLPRKLPQAEQAWCGSMAAPQSGQLVVLGQESVKLEALLLPCRELECLFFG